MRILNALHCILLTVNAVRDNSQLVKPGFRGATTGRRHESQSLSKKPDVVEVWPSRRIQAINVNYVQFNITIMPSNTLMDLCSESELLSIGLEIDQILLSPNLSIDSIGGDSNFVAGVCTEPEVSSIVVPEGSRALQGSPGWVWRGGGGVCVKCNPDNKDQSTEQPLDYRLLVNQQFIEEAAPPLITAAIMSQVVPNHQDCFGVDPKVEVTMIPVKPANLVLKCSGDLLPDLPSAETLAVKSALP